MQSQSRIHTPVHMHCLFLTGVIATVSCRLDASPLAALGGTAGLAVELWACMVTHARTHACMILTGVIATVSCRLDASHLAALGGTSGLAAGLVGIVTAFTPAVTKWVLLKQSPFFVFRLLSLVFSQDLLADLAAGLVGSVTAFTPAVTKWVLLKQSFFCFYLGLFGQPIAALENRGLTAAPPQSRCILSICPVWPAWQRPLP